MTLKGQFCLLVGLEGRALSLRHCVDIDIARRTGLTRRAALAERFRLSSDLPHTDRVESTPFVYIFY